MKSKSLLTVLALVLVLTGFTYTYNSVQFWGFDGVSRAKEWVSPDGRMSLQAQLSDQSTAIDMWPTSGTTPTAHSLAELTLNRYQWDNPAMERISLSAMVNQSQGGVYRNDLLYCPYHLTHLLIPVSIPSAPLPYEIVLIYRKDYMFYRHETIEFSSQPV